MKKQYEQPELKIEAFDVEDVITASGGLMQTFTDAMQTLWEGASNLFHSLDNNP
jgi:hypothetical protein